MENDIQNLIQEGIKDYMNSSQYGVTKIPSHLHNGADTPKITVVDLPVETPLLLGLGGAISSSNSLPGKGTVPRGSVGEQIMTAVVSGPIQTGGIGNSGGNLQFNLLHQPQNILNQSFITAFRPPLFATYKGTTITVTVGGNTVTASGWNFATDYLAGALINIFDSTGSHIETQTILSNTSTTITIIGTWLATTIGGTYYIIQPVYFGSADTPYQRFYTQEGTGGGIRFGVGPTNGGQNGLLYSDATGDLYWRNKGGSSTKLN